ncbi:MAG: agmatinase [Rhodospirillaceae bacterium]|nr:agmatinase [Rhodospirillaceae bacterium]
MQPTFSGPRTFLQLPAALADGSAPDVTIVGVPFDLGTTNRPGSRFGPAAIREASLMLVDGDHPELRVNPATTLRAIDGGDLDIVNGYMDESLALIERQIADIPGHVITLGGDHTVTLPILRARAGRDGKGISLVHFDAHVDTWKDNFGGPVGHGTPFHYAAQEGLIDPKRSIQIGIRSPVDNETMDYTRDALGFTVITAEDVHVGGIEQVIAAIEKTVGNNPAYLTFDIDAIDPGQAPGTGTPEVGGLFTWQALAILKRLGGINWIGMDMVEVAPAYDQAQITALAAATFVWTYLCLLIKKGSSDE